MSIQSIPKKPVVPFLLIMFIWTVTILVMPLQAGTQAPERDTRVESCVQPGEMGSIEIEKETTGTAKLTKKKFPWLWIAIAGTIAAAAVVYFLVIKKSEGLHEDFDKKASANWLPGQFSNWSVSGGYYHCLTVAGESSGTGVIYNQAWSKNTFTVTMKVAFVKSDVSWAQILLAKTTDMNEVEGYSFGVSSAGKVMIVKSNKMSYITLKPNTYYNYLLPLAINPHVVHGVNQWNELKVVRNGSMYTFSVNGQLVSQVTDATYDPRYTGISLLNYQEAQELLVDYYYVDIAAGGTSALAPSPQSIYSPSADQPSGLEPGMEF